MRIGKHFFPMLLAVGGVFVAVVVKPERASAAPRKVQVGSATFDLPSSGYEVRGQGRRIKIEKTNQGRERQGKSKSSTRRGEDAKASQQDENAVEVFHVFSYSTDMNFSVGGKYIDGDSPSSIIKAILDTDAERYSKLIKKGTHRKSKTKYGDAVYVGVIEAVASPQRLLVGPAPVSSRGFGVHLSPEMKSKLESMRSEKVKVFHVLLKGGTEAFHHIAIETRSKAASKNKKLINSVLTSLGTGYSR